MKAIHLIQQPYRGERGSPDRSDAPAYVDDAALHTSFSEAGAKSVQSIEVQLTPEEDARYGEWQRVALANAHLARHVVEALDSGALPTGLLANCNSLPGMLAGLQKHQGEDARIGLVWIDAHADFNTPETTLSGMLGGMPVALSCGLCLHRLRETAGMTRPISPAHVLMFGLRDVDRQERALLDDHQVRCFDLSPDSTADRLAAVRELALQVSAIYLHIDMDVLDPADVPGHPLTVPGGPTAVHLAAHLSELMALERVEATGLASVPPPSLDGGGTAKTSAHRLLFGIGYGFGSRGNPA